MRSMRSCQDARRGGRNVNEVSSSSLNIACRCEARDTCNSNSVRILSFNPGRNRGRNAAVRARAKTHFARAPHFCKCRILFLERDLLLYLAPGADFKAAADPAQGLVARGKGFGVANRTICGFFQTVCGNRPFGVFQQLSRYWHGWLSCFHALISLRSVRRFCWWTRFSFHSVTYLIPLSQKQRCPTTGPAVTPLAASALLPPHRVTTRIADNVDQRSRARLSAYSSIRRLQAPCACK